MKETKTFCDICKKEFTDTGFTIDLSLDRLGYMSSMDCKYKDVCGSCANKISIFIKTLEK